ncbi:MAG: Nramp family divalent metal transporter [Bacteroidetes bacterium]|nr:Nramp family divalent metal transporter [Bacteroidota bacterium]
MPPPDDTLASPADGWRRPRHRRSLDEVYGSIATATRPSSRGRFWAFFGPGLLVAVGYMDPGNWATDLAGGARYGYLLLSVVLLSNLFAMLLQHLAVKLGLATGRDLAQACRDAYPTPVAMALWVLAEIAIAATDLAEIIGTALALNLLFGLPLPVGVVLTVFDVAIVLALQRFGFRWIEAVVGGLIAIIGAAFLYEIVVSQPVWADVAAGLLPSPRIVTEPGALYLAVGILGATVMPHNLYLHSAIVQTRQVEPDEPSVRKAIRYATVDSSAALSMAFFVNAAILVLAAATFHGTAHADVADIHDAYRLLSPTLGAPLASVLFAVALLAAGQNSTLTGTIAGQVVMEGFLNLRMKPWARRLLTRLVAVIPAAWVAVVYGERGTGELLVLSQVVLSLQLSFAVVPLVMLTSSRAKMGPFANGPRLRVLAWAVTAVIAGLNGYLLWETVRNGLGS